MGEQTGISWTDHTFNPWWGCVKVSEACEHCYAADLAARFGVGWGPKAARRFASEATWAEPLKWHRKAQAARRPAFVFCASMADIFEAEPEHAAEKTAAARARLWALIESTPWLTWLLLTKRPERIAQSVPVSWMSGAWPRNAWAGATTENQRRYDQRAPALLRIPAPVRFVSIEPAQEYVNVDFSAWEGNGIGWAIVGGESGPKARPFDVNIALRVLNASGMRSGYTWVKQLGSVRLGLTQDYEDAIKHRAGADMSEWPACLRVQQRPPAWVPNDDGREVRA